MGISPHEKQQFEAIVSGFDVSDITLVRKLEKKAKASEMTFTPLPHLPAFRLFLCYAFLVCAVACSPISFFLIENDIKMSLLVLMLAPIFLLCAYRVRPKSFSR